MFFEIAFRQFQLQNIGPVERDFFFTDQFDAAGCNINKVAQEISGLKIMHFQVIYQMAPFQNSRFGHRITPRQG
jgi:hypothetical protein